MARGFYKDSTISRAYIFNQIEDMEDVDFYRTNAKYKAS